MTDAERRAVADDADAEPIENLEAAAAIYDSLTPFSPENRMRGYAHLSDGEYAYLAGLAASLAADFAAMKAEAPGKGLAAERWRIAREHFAQEHASVTGHCRVCHGALGEGYAQPDGPGTLAFELWTLHAQGHCCRCAMRILMPDEAERREAERYFQDDDRAYHDATENPA